MNAQHEQEINDARRQNNTALIIGIIIVSVGFSVVFFGSKIFGLLVAIFGLLLYMSMSINAGIAQISLNQCIVIDLQQEGIRVVREKDTEK